MNRIIQIYFIPASVLVSVIMGGGYGTGREVVEYFTRYGAWGGLKGQLVATFAFMIVISVTFEFSRIFRVYDYRSLLRLLLGKGWLIFEILFITLFLLVIGVVSSAISEIMTTEFAIDPAAGSIVMLGVSTFLVFFGREFIEKALTSWTIFMYLVFIIYFMIVLNAHDFDVKPILEARDGRDGWFFGGLSYAFYNVSLVPVLIYVAASFKTRKEALVSGAIAGFVIMIPATLFHASFIFDYPDILEQAVPNYWILKKYAGDGFLLIFVVALSGTLIETAVGLVQGIVERVDTNLQEVGRHALGPIGKIFVAFTALLVGGAIGTFGIVSLIAQGYTLISVGFALIYILPICTWGVYRIARAKA